MKRKIQHLSSSQKAGYINLHLFNELRWMLGAATEWSIQEQLKLGIVGYDVWVYAMDSAFLHARSLFEFFLNPTTLNHYGCNEFLGSNIVLKSEIYENQWAGPLHAFLMHSQDRSNPMPLKSLDGNQKTLNRMVVDFAQEILRLWKEFETRLGDSKDPEDKKLGELAAKKREEAIRNTECVVNSEVAQRHAKERGQVLKHIFTI